ncbi:class I SAM-dependent methyltransferase [Weissella soli]|uniref:Site-specific DNA-methyltransferase (Adenine-specific) n=1 Tax=Weissella soli TaxID=155866 RepID=A0A288Q6R3_9LACO|nr:class I SAM-dependent methyltransferase [Weissella soli]AOT56787.1 Site-specific DNA-methyltransferase (adenine-specific) [Weissella soli]NKY83239.1 class I SAM-dependent methyltransferase [Weissella soli]RDL12349.1 site-specific DNA-methyltransferase (adenine-specific) [Weissella soli]GEN92404.1 DNA methyltransferase [Weissella soli]
MYEEITTATNQLQQAIKLIAAELDISTIEATIILFSVMLDQEDVDFASLSGEMQGQIHALIAASAFQDLAVASKRQVLQFLLVSVMQTDGLPANYQVTPDAIGMWVGYIAEQFAIGHDRVRLTDVAIGSGNLVATVSQVLATAAITTTVIGYDNDDTLLTVASGLAALLGYDWQLELGDAVALTAQSTTDLLISDLPVGYYPKDEVAHYQVNAAPEKTFAHHLLIEQGMRQLIPGGLGIFVAPANLFESDQAKQLLGYLQSDEVYLQGMLRFPDKLFVDPAVAKVLLILQRAGAQATQAEPVMLGQIPEVANKAANAQFISEFSTWMQDNHLKMPQD